MAYVEELQGVHYDELIGGTAVTPINRNVVLSGVAANAVVGKGTLLALGTDGKYVVAAKAGDSVPVASAVLAYDVTQGTDVADLTVTVYVAGMFNRERLIAAEGDTVDAHEEELRDVGIYLTSVKGGAAGVVAYADAAVVGEHVAG